MYADTYILITALMLCSCSKSEAPVEVDARLAPYFAAFEDEASQRGLTYDLEELRISAVMQQLADGASGQCAKGAATGHVIRIDPEYWSSVDEDRKEFLIFHELGHCVLDRSHDDRKNASGQCISIMHSGTGDCTNSYSQGTRKQYLDELFEL